MRECNNILLVVQSAEDAKSLLPKAKRLASIEEDATVHIIRVAYERLADLDVKDVEASAELKNFILKSAEETLKEDIALSGTTLKNTESATLWGRKAWEVILHAAESVDADLIVKAATKTAGSTLIRTPDDWNLLRHSKIPVLLCDSIQWSRRPRIVAAVDVFDEDHDTLNIRILRQASGLADGLNGVLEVVTVFPSLEPWTTNFATFQNYQKVMEDIACEAASRLKRLLDAHDMSSCSRVSIEGRVEEVIKRVVAQNKTEMLVVGTTARTGLEGVVIGNTAEQLLHDTQIDVVTVP